MGVSVFFVRRCAAAVAVSAAALIWAPSALADTTTSTNWAGYAAHGNGAVFRTVQGFWRQPSASCVRGGSAYSSYWVGIGGYSQTSQALDQIGTEVDCTPGGQAHSSAWYELVPAAAVQLQLAVHPGDLMRAGVTVNGRRVALSLYDVTRGRGLSKTLTASLLDTTSAEWIVEAPSECLGPAACQTLPLANFGTAGFTDASATTTTGHTGGINDQAWQATRIKLVPDGRRYFVSNGAVASIGTATPSAVGADSRSFKVFYSAVSAAASHVRARISSVLGAAALRHPGR